MICREGTPDICGCSGTGCCNSLEDTLTALASRISNAEQSITNINTALQGKMDTASLSAYATITWTTAQIAAAVSGLASQTWTTNLVNSAITSYDTTLQASLNANYATITWVQNQLNLKMDTTTLSGYATQAWVTTQLGSISGVAYLNGVNSFSQMNTFEDVTVNDTTTLSGAVTVTGAVTSSGSNTWTGTQIFQGNIFNIKNANVVRGTVPASGQATIARITDANNLNLAQLQIWTSSNGNSSLFIQNSEQRNGLQPNPAIGVNVSAAGVGSTIAVTPGATAGSTEIATVGYVSDTGGSLNNLMHTNAAEEFSGAKTGRVSNYNAAFITKIPSINVSNPPSTETLGLLKFTDTNNVTLANIRVGYGSDGLVTVGLQLRNNDGTYKYATLAKGDN